MTHSLYKPTMRGPRKRTNSLQPICVAPQYAPFPSLSLARAECYMLMLNTNDQFMEEKQKRCKRCHGGTLHATLNPNEMKCNYCGWTRIEMNLADYVASKGYIGP